MNARINSLTARQTEVTYCGVPMLVTFDYEPGGHPMWNPVYGGDPGWPANATLITARVGGVDVTEMLTEGQRESIEEAVLEQME